MLRIFRWLGLLVRFVLRVIYRLLSIEKRPDYDPVGKLVFVTQPPPDSEFSYRKVPDGSGRTWKQKTRGAVFDALEDLIKHAADSAGWDHKYLRAGFDLGRRMMGALDGLLPTKENFRFIRLGQRLTTGIVKIAFFRTRTPTEADYLRVGGKHKNNYEAGEYTPPGDHLLSDEMFAFMRVGGMNPTLLRKATPDDDLEECGARDDIQRALGGPQALKDAVQDGRLYLIPPAAFGLLREHLRSGAGLEHPYRCNFLGFPTAVFVLPKGTRDLRPVCIRFAKDLDTIAPGDRRWDSAKFHFGVADCIHHTFVRHLPQTHFVLEPIVIATRRCLGRSHELHRLLAPHLEGTNAVNWVARNSIPPSSSPFADFVASDVWSTFKLAGEAFAEVANGAFKTIYDPQTFPRDALRYPWRDDFHRLTIVLKAWVDWYVGENFDNAGIAKDDALQKWAAEIRNADQGRITKFPQINTVEDLQDVALTIIQHATLQHAAFHFAQTDLGRITIMNPFCATDVVPGLGDAAQDKITRLETLPNLYAAAWQSFIFGQTVVRWRPITELETRFNRANEEQPMKDFNEGLARARAAIDTRNRELEAAGLLPYEYLLPANIPCSINA